MYRRCLFPFSLTRNNTDTNANDNNYQYHLTIATVIKT
uniref:Uncharacterized protein n=1 Tax=Escherichia coli TaxID=562 RepID=A0A075M9X3_ECOLX|nr:hypothetical protein [Escherichia coli]